MSTRPHKKVIFIDFDGVIVNTFDFCFRIYHKVVPDVSKEDYRAFFEGNIYEALRHHIQNVRLLLVDFWTPYRRHLLKKPLSRGMRQLIATLSKKYTLVILSSTESSIIHEYLEKKNLLAHFAEVLGADVGRSKVRKIKKYLRQHDLRPKQTLFVTDTLGDLREAAEVGVPAIGVTWGYHRESTLAQGKSVAIARKPKDIFHYLR